MSPVRTRVVIPSSPPKTSAAASNDCREEAVGDNPGGIEAACARPGLEHREQHRGADEAEHAVGEDARDGGGAIVDQRRKLRFASSAYSRTVKTPPADSPAGRRGRGTVPACAPAPLPFVPSFCWRPVWPAATADDNPAIDVATTTTAVSTTTTAAATVTTAAERSSGDAAGGGKGPVRPVEGRRPGRRVA